MSNYMTVAVEYISHCILVMGFIDVLALPCGARDRPRGSCMPGSVALPLSYTLSLYSCPYTEFSQNDFEITILKMTSQSS